MPSTDIYQPYTYLIGWAERDRWYYGVRFAKGCSPSDLWVTYFTSSKLVAEYRLQYGEPDVVAIRKMFTTRTSAINWEAKVLQRMRVVEQHKWLNRSCSRQNHDKIDQITRNLTAFRTPEYRAKRSLLNNEAYEKGSIDMSYRQDDSYRGRQSTIIQNLYKTGVKSCNDKDRQTGQYPRRPVSVLGVTYRSITEAARASNISVKAAYNRLNKGSWPDWNYA